PLYALVGKEFSDRVAGIHRLIEPLTILLVLAHLGAIVYYVSFKKETLIMPMITGWKVMRSGIPGDGADTAPALQGGRARNALLAVADGETAQGGGALAFCFALAIALGAAYGASGAWIASPPSTAAPAAAPNW
ncbi:MAG: hypothetical protein Q8S20_15140, partial [Sulfuritalea sp.]|nr:hypothetical protein [Sulfuritalea sp.]